MKRFTIAGSFYRRDQGYIPPMGHAYWKGLLMLNDCQQDRATFDLTEVSIEWLERKYG